MSDQRPTCLIRDRHVSSSPIGLIRVSETHLRPTFFVKHVQCFSAQVCWSPTRHIGLQWVFGNSPIVIIFSRTRTFLGFSVFSFLFCFVFVLIRKRKIDKNVSIKKSDMDRFNGYMLTIRSSNLNKKK